MNAMTTVQTILVQVIEKPARKVLIKRDVKAKDYFAYCDEVWQTIQKYNSVNIGYEWDDTNPKIQIEPRGERRYIEFVAVRKL